MNALWNVVTRNRPKPPVQEGDRQGKALPVVQGRENAPVAVFHHAAHEAVHPTGKEGLRTG